jgi:hypothetical protein
MHRTANTDTHILMRPLLIIIVIAALGYFGWTYYRDHKGSLPSSIPFLSNSSEPASPAEEPPFVSKVKIPEPPADAPPGAKPTAPPGFFYVLDRTSVETPNGVIAIVPGDLVKLLERKGNGKLRVTNDQADFDLKEEQVTQDPEVAQVAEKRDFDKRSHRP